MWARWTVVLALALAGCAVGGGDTELDGGDAIEAIGDAATDAPADEAQAPMPTADEVLAPGPFVAASFDVELEDTTRKTMANGKNPEKPSRRLETRIWYPVSQASARRSADATEPPVAVVEGGPRPLIVYCHGFMSENRENTDLAALLASRGFVVAAPQFPLTSLGTPGGPNAADVVNQPGDVRFVIDRMLAMAADAASPLHGAIDAERIGTIGVSLGGLTAVLAGFHEDLRDPRIKAVAGAAVPGCYMAEGFFDAVTLPLLLLHGTRDVILPFVQNGPPVYAAAHPPKHFVRITGGTHAGMAALAKEMLELMGNSDEIGCQALASNQSVKPEALAAMSESFGGKEAAAVLAECPALCGITIDEGEPKIEVGRQLRIVNLAASTFMEGYLGGDASAARYLREGLAGEGTDLAVEQSL
jgi:predicted dienelactone hydrolase